MNSQKMDDDLVPLVRVNTTTELPVECYPGFKVQVMNSFNEDDDYYLEYRAESESGDTSSTKADGFWEEIAKPYEPMNPINSSMPHMITAMRTSIRTDFIFVVSPMTWYNRTAGTSRDNPSLFDGGPITSINYYKNRLIFGTSKGTVCSSRAGEINNVFINTATTTSTIDPIDLIANSNKRVPITGSIVTNNAMVLFGESEQYSLNSDSAAFTTETVNITKVSDYTFDKQSEAVTLGTNIGFVSKGLTRFYEMTNVYDRGPVDINERSQQIQTQFGRGYNVPVSSREQSIVAVHKKYEQYDSVGGRGKDVFIYRYRQENSQDSSQTSWVRWRFDEEVAYITMPRDKMFVVIGDTLHSKLYKIDGSTLAGFAADTSASLGVSPVYMDGWYRDEDDNLILDDAEPYMSRIRFPTIYPRGREAYDITANTTIHRVKLSTTLVGTYNLKIERDGYDTYEIMVDQTPSDDYDAGSDTIRRDHIETVPIYTRNNNLTLTMSTDYNAPLTLRSMTWEGDMNPPYYNRA